MTMLREGADATTRDPAENSKMEAIYIFFRPFMSESLAMIGVPTRFIKM
jgi:hypothetical protein